MMELESQKIYRVTAALISMEGRIFIAQRPPHKNFGLFWEFPGGKVEAGESLEQSLVREIREELCWQIEVGELFRHICSPMQVFSIELYAFWCGITEGELCLREHVAYYWAHPKELDNFQLTLADRQLVRPLQELSNLPPPPSWIQK